MKEFENILEGLCLEDTRSTLYYLSRYLKLTPTQDEYEKDIFEDDERSMPSAAVKETTGKLIAFIEHHENMPASDFSEEQYDFWAQHVMDFESQLEPDASDETIAKANAFIESLSTTEVTLKGKAQE